MNSEVNTGLGTFLNVFTKETTVLVFQEGQLKKKGGHTVCISYLSFFSTPESVILLHSTCTFCGLSTFFPIYFIGPDTAFSLSVSSQTLNPFIPILLICLLPLLFFSSVIFPVSFNPYFCFTISSLHPNYKKYRMIIFPKGRLP